MEPVLWTLLSVAVVSAVSLIGAVGLSFGALRNHTVMMALIALAAGTLIGDSFLHILPEASAHDGFSSQVGVAVLMGFFVMFGLEIALRRGHSHVEDVGHHEHLDGHMHAGESTMQIAPFGWLNLVGDAVHNFLDGAIIAAAFMVDTYAGIATTIAVVLHEVPQELGDFAILVRSGMPVKKALLLNFATALMAVLGAGVILFSGMSEEILATWALPLVAGGFIYIAAADLVPELHHHSKGRDMAVIVLALLAGVLLMVLMLGLESALFADHGHGHSH